MKFKVGDMVRVADRRHTYRKYEAWMRNHAENYISSWTSEKIPANGEICEVVVVAPHSSYPRMLYLCKNKNKQVFIMGECGIEAVESNKILITTDGTTTLARLYDGKKVVKSAEAKCSPSDTYSFDTGASIAFDRLMGKDNPAEVSAGFRDGDRVYISNTRSGCCGADKKYGVVTSEKHTCGLLSSYDGINVRLDDGSVWRVNKEALTRSDKPVEKPVEEKPLYPFKPGEKVMFREWNDMADQYGVDKDGDIGPFPRFTTRMRHLCGTRATVHSVYENRVSLKDFSASGNTNWSYAPWMLTPYIDAPPAPEPPKEPEGWSGKAICKRLDAGLTKWKTYEFVNGYTTDDDGDKRPAGGILIVKNTDSEWLKGNFIVCD